MKVHSAINRGLMFEWLQDCFLEGEPIPTDEAIMDRFQFETPELARTLLADLADRGLIAISGTGPDRTVTIGRAKLPPTPAPRPIPSVRKPVAAAAPEQSNADRIREILAKGKAAVSPTPVPRPAPVPTQTPVETPVQPKPVAVPPALVEQLSDAARRRIIKQPEAPAAPTGPKKQLNIHMPMSLFERLERRADETDETPSAYMRRQLDEHLSGSEPDARFEFEPGRKPRVRAAIVAAAQRDGAELHDFLTDLMERGFAAYQAEQIEHAEAAE